MLDSRDWPKDSSSLTHRATLERRAPRATCREGRWLVSLESMTAWLSSFPATAPAGLPPLEARERLTRLARRSSMLASMAPSLAPGEAFASVRLYEDERRCLALFRVRAGAKIELHDHPGMTVVFHVVAGRAQLEVFDWLELDTDGAGRATRFFSGVVDVGSGARAVLPDRENLHAIEALDELLFLDLFSPDYDPEAGRGCSFYRVLERRGEVYELRREL
jgi:hypothetical protein